VKVKLDENVPRRAVQLLADAGHQVDTVLDEGLGGAPDADVLRAAISDGRLLVTLAAGSPVVRSYPPGAHAGILVLRPGDQSAPSVAALLGELLAGEDLDALAKAIAIAQPGLLRVRRG